MRTTGAIAVLSFALAALAPSIARADDTTDAAAEQKRQGDEAMDAGRAAEALAAYRRAAAIAPSPSLDYNIGRALLAIGDFAAALDAFERYDATAPEDLKKKTHRLSEVMSELRAKVSTLEVAGDAGARVTLRGRGAGALPLAPLRTNPGRAEVRVEKEGFVPFVVEVDLPAGGTSRIVAVLRRVPDTGRLAIAARPETARITIDGVVRGAPPLDLEIASGTHEVLVEAPSYVARRTTVTVARGEARRIDMDLAPERRAITSRWWFWTGIGAVVVGAGVTVFALTTERSHGEGSLGTYHVP